MMSEGLVSSDFSEGFDIIKFVMIFKYEIYYIYFFCL